MTGGLSAYGVELPLPSGWEDRTVFRFVGPASAQASLTVVDLGETTLDAAVDTLEPEGGLEVSVLRAEMREASYGAYYERVIRYQDPVSQGAVQQSLRLVPRMGKVFALGFSSRAADFNDQYRTFAEVAEAFARGLGPAQVQP